MNTIMNAVIANPFGSGSAGSKDEPVFDPRTYRPSESRSGDGYGVSDGGPMGSRCEPLNDLHTSKVQSLRFLGSAQLFIAAKTTRVTPPTPDLPEESDSDSGGDLYGPDGRTPGGIDPDRGSDSHYEETYEGGDGGRNGDYLG